MKKFYFNWKNYCDQYPQNVVNKLKSIDLSRVKVFAPDIYMYQLGLEIDSNFVGSQNINHISNQTGAFTGLTSVLNIKNGYYFGSLVGHSEVRKNLGISIDDCLKQISYLNNLGLNSVFCVGTAEINDKTAVENYAIEDIKKLVKLIKSENLDINLIEIAYEPMWAIGSGQSDSRENIDNFFRKIKELLTKGIGENNITLLYGGSVSSKNIDDLNKSDLIDGYLIGGASVKIEELDCFFG